MAEAVARVERRASEIGNTIQKLEQDTSALIEQLKQVDSVAARAADTLENYRQKVAKGAALAPAEEENRKNLVDYIGQYGGDTGRAYLNRSRAIDDVTRGDTGPRDLTPEERATYRASGYTDEQLDRARMLGPGRILVRPPSMPEPAMPPPPMNPGPSVSPGPREPGGPPPLNPGPEPTGGPEMRPGPVPGGGGVSRGGDAGVSGDTAGEAAAMARNLDTTDDALLRHAARSRFAAMSERELHEQWKETNRALKDQQRELEQVESRRAKLQRYSLLEGGISAREEDDLRNEIPRRYQDLREGERALTIERQVLEGMGAQNAPGPLSGFGGGFRGAVGAFAGAGGFGGGLPGAIAGTIGAFATGGPWAALGYGGARLVGAAAESYDKRVSFLGNLEPLGRMISEDPEGMESAINRLTRQYRVFQRSQLAGATNILGRGTGSSDLSGTLPVAALTGMSPEEIAVTQSRLAAIMPGVDPDIAMQILAQFRESGGTRRTAALLTHGEATPRVGASGSWDDPSDIGRGAAGWGTGAEVSQRAREWMKGNGGPGPMMRPPREMRGPDFDPKLFPFFLQAVLQATAAQDNPFTGVPVGGVTAQVGEATWRSFPGIDRDSPAQMRAAGALAQQFNQFASGNEGDAIGDMKMLGVLGLRNTPMARRLKDQLGIDISTPLGVMRAMQHASTLAQMEATDPEANRGFGDVQRSMMGAVRRFMGPETLGLALTMGRGMDPETAYQLSRPESDDLIGARVAKADKQGLTDAGQAILSGGLATRTAGMVYQTDVLPEVLGGEFGQAISGAGSEAQGYVNQLKQALVDVVRDVLSAEIGQDLPD